MKNPARRGLFHPDDIKVYSFGSTSTGPRSAPLPNLNKKASRSSLGPLITPSGASNGPLTSVPSHSRSSSTTGSFGHSEARQLQGQTDLEFEKYAEEEDEDYEDVFGKPSGASEFTKAVILRLPNEPCQINPCKRYNSTLDCQINPGCVFVYDMNHILTILRLQLGDEHPDEEDPFAEVDLYHAIILNLTTVVRLMKVFLKMTWSPIFSETSMPDCVI